METSVEHLVDLSANGTSGAEPVPPDEARAPRVDPEVARRLRASAVGLHCAVVSLASNLEALCDSGLPPSLRRRRSEELYGQLGDAQRALAQLTEAVLARASGNVAAVEADPVVKVPASSWLRWRRVDFRSRVTYSLAA